MGILLPEAEQGSVGVKGKYLYAAGDRGIRVNMFFVLNGKE